MGLSREQIFSVLGGTTPEGLKATGEVIYKTAIKLARTRKPLDREGWQEAEDRLGKESAALFGHLAAWFVYNCTLLNLGAIKVPSDQVGGVEHESQAHILSNGLLSRPLAVRSSCHLRKASTKDSWDSFTCKGVP